MREWGPGTVSAQSHSNLEMLLWGLSLPLPLGFRASHTHTQTHTHIKREGMLNSILAAGLVVVKELHVV